MVVDRMLKNDSVSWLDGIINEDARKLIELDSPTIRVVAGPGSGKTTCLKRRIQRLVQKDQIDPEQMFVGTFTRTIAKELKDSLDAQVKVSTVHSLAYEMLREYPNACQGMQLRFLLQYEEDMLLYDIMGKMPIRDLYACRRELKQLQSDKAQRAIISNARLDGAIEDWLRKHRAMLIGDTVYLCVVGLDSQDIHPGQFDYVMIDEYQDLTAAEQEFVDRIWSRNGTLLVMGDDDQSIYSFRFNHPQGIEKFLAEHPECKDLTFNHNYRCGKHILDAANLMMAKAGSKKPEMILARDTVGSLKAVVWDTLDCEITGLAKYIREHAEETFLVLVPRRFIGYRLAKDIGDDAKTAFHEQVLDHPITQEVFATASLLADAEDFVAARTYLGFHGTKQKRAPRCNADAYSGMPPDIGGHDLIYCIANGEIPVSGNGQRNIKERAKTAVRLIERNLSANEIIDLLFNEELAQGECNDEKRDWLIDNLQELHDAAHEHLANQDTPDLSKVMATLRYRISTRAPLSNAEPQEPRVKIMTLHSAKGIEADNVIIAGIAEQFMPGRNTDSEERREQTRLLYVAITRARDSLIISWPRLVQMRDMDSNNGAGKQIETHDGVKYYRTSRSSLLPPSLPAIIPGKQLRHHTSE